MVHDDYKEMIPARALSALDATEDHALNEHLENCSECRRELEEWQATASALALASDPAEPSPKVRERILSEVRKDQSSTPEVIPFKSTSRNIWSSFGSLGAIAAVVLVTALIAGVIVLWRQNRAIREQLARANEFVELVNTPGARVSELKGIDLGQGATAKLAYDRTTGRAILTASKLPTVPQGKAYQLWFIVGNKPPIPGKTFVPDSTGNAVLKDQMPKEAVDANLFAITVEPAGGVSAPTGPMYLRSFEVN
ncbi:MAG TPA: anti-sigma factor [Pyrinomonadaceae bacterium]|nr:anti-sigma factor [Pyrinomonadaceae bacterium]